MKKILFFIAIICSIGAGAQTSSSGATQIYTPLLQQFTGGAPLDRVSQYYVFNGTTYIFRDYNGTAEAITANPIGSKYRVGNHILFIHIGGTLNSNGTYTGGKTVYYTWWNGVADVNLVPLWTTLLDVNIIPQANLPVWGTNGQVLYNNAGAPDGNNAMVFNSSNGQLTLSNQANIGAIRTAAPTGSGGAQTTIKFGSISGNTAAPNTMAIEADNGTRYNVPTTAYTGWQTALVSGTNIKTINGTSLLGSGNISISGGGGSAWGDITGTLSSQSDLNTALGLKADKTYTNYRIGTTGQLEIKDGSGVWWRLTINTTGALITTSL